MNHRINAPMQVGQLFADDILGNNIASTDQGKKKNIFRYLKPSARPKKLPETRIERLMFAEVTENSEPLRAVIPYLNREAIARTMTNYRLYIADYNEKIRAENGKINTFNDEVKKFKHSKEFTPLHNEHALRFITNNWKLKAKKYNELVDKFCDGFGLIVEKKQLQLVKYATEIVFQQMLHIYAKRLALHSNQFEKVGTTELHTVLQIEINAFDIVNLKRDGVFSLDVSTKTIRNHRERLEECGVLYHYYFQGWRKGLKMHINSQILTVFDAKKQNFVEPENQAVTSPEGKKVTSNDEATGAFKSNIKKNEIAQGEFLVKGTPSAGFLFDFYRSTIPQDAKSKLGAAAENVKVSNTFSEKLQNHIIHDQELALMLSEGAFNNHNRVNKKYFTDEAYNGTMTREEFKQLVVQEFFKNAARLYRGKNVFVGSWKKAINSYMENLFLARNGNETFLYSKQLMAEKLEEMLWRLNNAQKWFLKTKINPLFPSDYFDFNRKTAKEIGFEYTKLSYQKHLKYLETKPMLAKQVKKKAEIRLKTINHSKKFDAKLNSFFKNRIQLPELIEYVNANLPAEYLQKLSDTLLKISETKYSC